MSKTTLKLLHSLTKSHSVVSIYDEMKADYKNKSTLILKLNMHMCI